jgi:hypothetical protein
MSSDFFQELTKFIYLLKEASLKRHNLGYARLSLSGRDDPEARVAGLERNISSTETRNDRHNAKARVQLRQFCDPSKIPL